VAGQLAHEQPKRVQWLPKIMARRCKKAGLGKVGEFELMGAFLEDLLGTGKLPYRIVKYMRATDRRNVTTTVSGHRRACGLP
jgi:hypothetical protein